MISRRPAKQDDLEFLYALMRESLGPYVIETFGPWNEAEQRERFFRDTVVQHHQVVEEDGVAIGCVCKAVLPEAVKLYRVYLRPGAQRRGIGSALVREEMSLARSLRRPLQLSVLRVNPARRLYERLGLRIIGETPTHYEMELS